MSWFADVIRKVTTGQTKAEKRAEEEAKRRAAELRAIGPSPQGTSLELESGATETPEQRRRRLARLASIINQGGDPYGELTLGKKGLLAR